MSSKETKKSFEHRVNEFSFTLIEVLSKDLEQRSPADDVDISRRYASRGLGGIFLFASVLRLLHSNHDSRQQPTRIIAALKIDHSDTVADLGAGGGYFTFRLEKAVGPHGRMLVVKVDEDRLSELSRKANELSLPNVEAVLANEASSELGPGSTDLILLCNTYHHIGKRISYFGALKRAFRPWGRVAIIKLNEVPWIHSLFLGPHSTNEYQSFQVFRHLNPKARARNPNKGETNESFCNWRNRAVGTKPHPGPRRQRTRSGCIGAVT